MALVVALVGGGIVGAFSLLMLNVLPGTFRRAMQVSLPLLAALELAFVAWAVEAHHYTGAAIAAAQVALAGWALWLFWLRLKAHWLFLRKHKQLKLGHANTIEDALAVAYTLAAAYPGRPITFSADSQDELTVWIGERSVAWLFVHWGARALGLMLDDFPHEERGEIAAAPKRLILCKDRGGNFKVETFSK